MFHVDEVALTTVSLSVLPTHSNVFRTIDRGEPVILLGRSRSTEDQYSFKVIRTGALGLASPSDLVPAKLSVCIRHISDLSTCIEFSAKDHKHLHAELAAFFKVYGLFFYSIHQKDEGRLGQGNWFFALDCGPDSQLSYRPTPVLPEDAEVMGMLEPRLLTKEQAEEEMLDAAMEEAVWIKAV